MGKQHTLACDDREWHGETHAYKDKELVVFFLREEMINETTEGTGRKREEKCVFEMLKASNL